MHRHTRRQTGEIKQKSGTEVTKETPNEFATRRDKVAGDTPNWRNVHNSADSATYHS